MNLLKRFVKSDKQKDTGHKQSNAAPVGIFYGVPLEKIQANPKLCVDGIPRFLPPMFEILKKPENASTQGLFRISGSQTEIQKLKETIDSGADITHDILTKTSIHTLTGLIKLFFRSMPRPLIPFELYEPMLSAFRINDWNGITQMLNRLSSTYRNFFNFLMNFLGFLSRFSDASKMTSNNLAIVFAPNLMKPEVEEFSSIARDMPLTISIIDYFIYQQAQLFPKNVAKIIQSTEQKAAQPTASVINNNILKSSLEQLQPPPVKSKKTRHRRLLSCEQKMCLDQATQIFSFYDVDDSGEIDHIEFLALHSELVRLGLTNMDPSTCLTELDENMDGMIQFQEFLDWLLYKQSYKNPNNVSENKINVFQSDEEKEIVRWALMHFKYFDKDGTGLINMNEFASLHRDLIKNNITKSSINQCLAEIKVNKQDKIEFKNYVNWILNIRMNKKKETTTQSKKKDDEQEIVAWALHHFQYFDVDSSGTIDQQEFVNLHKDLIKNNVTKDSLESCLAQIGTKGDIDFTRYVNWILNIRQKQEALAYAHHGVNCKKPQFVENQGHWSKHVDKKGRIYYYNSQTQTSAWDKPHGFVD